ncbi:DNA polymerase III subunit delta' [bacterium]|nr:DNA polymerase III subunit delta' [bacterium]
MAGADGADRTPIGPQSLLARGLVGQERVRAFLASAVEQRRVGAAYLFVGPRGAGKLDAAYALAQAILCPHGGCGTCDDCVRVAHRTHPDVHLLQPMGAGSYVIEQIRDLIDDIALAPVRAARKVYLIDDADLLVDASANALLKSLEEPPDTVTFVLLGTSRETILPTIVSRCQIVPFRPVSPDAALATLESELTAPREICRRAVGCCASATQARGFVQSAERQEARRLALRCLEVLPDADALDVLHAAAACVDAAKAPYEALKAEQDSAYDEGAAWMSASALKQLTLRLKRELTARQRSGMMEVFGAQRSLLRDALCLAAATGDEPYNDDFAACARTYADRLGLDLLPRALDATDQACGRVRRGVSPQLALETMLFDIKEMLTCQP